MTLDTLENGKTNEEILEHLIDEYGQSIKRLAFTYVKSWPVAEDLTQETFITCYTKLGQFRGESSYKTWIYKIAINKCKDCLKSKWYRYGFQLESVIEKISGRTESLEEQIVIREEEQILSQQVLSLSKKYREVIILYYYEDLKIWEIEELTGIKQETIKTRLRRAKQQLRQRIEVSE